jgi:O-antigen ligase
VRDYLRQNLLFITILTVWFFVGRSVPVAGYGVVTASLLLFLRREMYAEALMGLILVLILSDNSNRNGSFAFFSEYKDIYMIILTGYLFTKPGEFYPFDNYYRKYIPFFAVALLCLVYSPIVTIAFQKTLSYLLLVVIIPNYFLKAWRVEGAGFLRNFILFIATILFVGLTLRVASPASVSLAGRFSGSLGNPNGLALFCVLFFMIFSIISQYYEGLFNRLEKIFIYTLVFLLIYMSESRGALMSVLIFLLFRWLYNVSPIVGFLLFLLILFGYQVVIDNLAGIINALNLQTYFRINTLESGSGRLIAWNFAWDEVQKSLWLGGGFNYTEYLYRVNYVVLSLKGHEGNAHNSYLTFWLDTGLVGLVSYMVSLIGSFIQASRHSRLAIPMLYTILFSAYFESWLTASLNPFTLFVFIGITLLIHAPEMIEETEEETENAIEEDPVPIH